MWPVELKVSTKTATLLVAQPARCTPQIVFRYATVVVQAGMPVDVMDVSSEPHVLRTLIGQRSRTRMRELKA